MELKEVETKITSSNEEEEESTIGLTNEEASKRWIEAIERGMMFASRSSFQISRDVFVRDLPMGFVACIFIIMGTSGIRKRHEIETILVGCVILIVCFLNIFLEYRRDRCERMRVPNLLRRTKSSKIEDNHHSSSVACFRDQSWKWISPSVLVSGDIVALTVEQFEMCSFASSLRKLPRRQRRRSTSSDIGNSPSVLRRRPSPSSLSPKKSPEVCKTTTTTTTPPISRARRRSSSSSSSSSLPSASPKTSPELGKNSTPTKTRTATTTVSQYERYVVTETPALSIVNSSIRSSCKKKTKTHFRRQLQFMFQFQCIFSACATVVAFSVCLIRWFLEDGKDWEESLIVRPLRVTFCAFPVFLPFLLLLVESISASVLLSRLYPQKSLMTETLRRVFILLGVIVSSESIQLQFSRCVLDAIDRIGSVTAMCCVDPEVVCESEPLIEEMCVQKEDDGRLILDIHRDVNSRSGIRFEDTQWTRHLASLKPLGLCCLLNSQRTIDSIASLSKKEKNMTEFILRTRGVLYMEEALAHRSVSKEIGFRDGDLQSLDVIRELHCCYADRKKLSSLRETSLRIVAFSDNRGKRSKRNNGAAPVQLFACGDADTMLKRCGFFWNGEAICRLTESSRSQLKSIISRWSVEDFRSVGFAFVAVSKEIGNAVRKETSRVILCSSDDDMNKDEFRSLLNRKRFVFLGMTASRSQSCSDMQTCIEETNKSGIRFVYYSPKSFRQSKVIAAKMGLNTGWNTAISLRISGEDSSDRRRHQDAARLPVGIDAIRKHLAEVDNVPLLVPLFTDCTESTTRQMISIQQENGEVVLVVGGPNKGLCFEQADVSFVMRGHDSNDLDRVTGYQLLFPSDAPLGLVVSTLRLGRMLQNNVRQCLLMSIIGNVTLSVVLISVEWIELEIVLSLVLVVLPTISISHLFCVYEDNDVPRKRHESVIQVPFQQLSATLFKVVPANVLHPILCSYFWFSSELRVDLTVISIVLGWIAISAESVHATESLISLSPPFVWYVMSFLVLMFILIVSMHDSTDELRHLDWMDAVLVVVCPILSLICNEIVKLWDRKRHRRFMKGLRLDFDTRLGMHSPWFA